MSILHVLVAARIRSVAVEAVHFRQRLVMLNRRQETGTVHRMQDGRHRFTRASREFLSVSRYRQYNNVVYNIIISFKTRRFRINIIPPPPGERLVRIIPRLCSDMTSDFCSTRN